MSSTRHRGGTPLDESAEHGGGALPPIVALETLRPAAQSNLCFVRLHARDGSIGLGESFYGAPAVATYLHDVVAPQLLGLADPTPERVSRLLRPYVGYQGSGVETRGNGAIDIALWDLLGKTAGMPLVDLMGGRMRDSVRIYNTCAGSRYVSATTLQSSENWGLSAAGDEPYEDLHAFLTRPDLLARELFDEGVRGMKIWPFDLSAERSGGNDISGADLAEGIGIVEAIRAEVGFEMDVLVELHGQWSMRAAKKICRALEPLRPFWVEDPLPASALEPLAALRAEVDVPIALGETCVGRHGFLPLLQRRALDVVTIDVGWSGGLTEARKVASLADAFGVPIAPHDCTGPVSLAVALHLVLGAPNGLIQETTRASMRTWYGDFAEGLPAVHAGRIAAPAGAGHGVLLHDGFERRDDVDVRVTRA